MKIKTQLIFGAIGIAIIVALAWYSNQTPLTETPPPSGTASTTASADEQAIIREAVTEFGTKLQDVSLAAPANIVRQSIKDNYQAFLTPELYQSWESDVSQAPGRVTSSPWPDHIDVSTIQKNTDGSYSVTGSVIEMTSKEVTSGGTAGSYPVRITFVNRNGLWYISKFEKTK